MNKFIEIPQSMRYQDTGKDSIPRKGRGKNFPRKGLSFAERTRKGLVQEKDSEMTHFRGKDSERNLFHGKESGQHIRPRTNVLQNSFRFTGMNIWNSTPLHIRSSNNIVVFKKKLKSYLLQNDIV
jgi:hypothetical protein